MGGLLAWIFTGRLIGSSEQHFEVGKPEWSQFVKKTQHPPRPRAVFRTELNNSQRKRNWRHLDSCRQLTFRKDVAFVDSASDHHAVFFAFSWHRANSHS